MLVDPVLFRINSRNSKDEMVVIKFMILKIIALIDNNILLS